MRGRNEINKEFLVWNPTIDAVVKVVEDSNLKFFIEKVNDSGFITYKPVTKETLNHWEEYDLMGNECNSVPDELNCPYDFTSRCTLGRCDCKPKLIEN